jgi:trimeric autotransporter adhesin
MRTAIRMVLLNSKKYVLDLISAVVAAAYSLRRLYASYTGAAIRVRRSSDNAQRDIGFIGEHLDVFALLVFVGNGSGFVTTWYDQSGNGRHATQTDPARQPRIVTNGATITVNGVPSIDYTGIAGGRLSVAGGFAIQAVSAVAKNNLANVIGY